MMLFKVICDCRFSIEIYDYFIERGIVRRRHMDS